MSKPDRNQVLLVFDSLRYDIFAEADTPFLKSLGTWKKALTPAAYTFPAHMSFFVGKLPQVLDQTDYYDTIATRHDPARGTYRETNQLWRLGNPEAPRPALYELEGRNIIEGFRDRGYRTIGCGAVNWFKPGLPAASYLTEPFEDLTYFGTHAAERQVDWALERVALAKSEKRPYFLFLNFGETHVPFRFKDCGWGHETNPYGDADKCRSRQRACIEYLDREMARLFEGLEDFDAVLCGDHGEAMGEDGLWGHGFSHPVVLEVPMLVLVNAKPRGGVSGFISRLMGRG